MMPAKRNAVFPASGTATDDSTRPEAAFPKAARRAMPRFGTAVSGAIAPELRGLVRRIFLHFSLRQVTAALCGSAVGWNCGPAPVLVPVRVARPALPATRRRSARRITRF